MSRHTKGSALITALFIMALITSIVAAMSMQIQRQIERLHLTIKSDQLQSAQFLAKLWAINELQNTQKPLLSQGPGGLVLSLPTQIHPSLPSIEISGQLFDLQARFNINNLKDPLFRLYFYQLLRHQLPQTPMAQITRISQASADWILPLTPAQPTDPLAATYSQNHPPYVSAHMPMSSISEFRLIDGVTQNIYENLNPFMTALPETVPININTAPQEVLMGLGNGLKSEAIEELIAARAQSSDLRALNELLNRLSIPGQQVTTESQYFMIKAVATSSQLTQISYSLLKRTRAKNGLYEVHILQSTSDTL